MKLYVMRHGPAEMQSSTGRDEDRALTASGRQIVRRVAELLDQEGEAPLRILTSPLLRARQTAEIVAHTARRATSIQASETRDTLGVPIQTDVDLGLTPTADLTRLINNSAVSPGPGMMLVGHEPSLSAFLKTALGELPKPGLERGAVVALEMVERSGLPGYAWSARMLFVLDPTTLRVVRTPV